MSTDIQKRPIPRKLNKGMIQALSLAIAKGNYAVTACQLCDITEQALWDWHQQAKTDYELGLDSEESIYIKLAEALKRAESQAEAELVNVVRESAIAKKEWLPAMTFLERRHPDRWGRKDRTKIDIEKKTVTITRVEIVLSDIPVIEGEYKEVTNGQEGTDQGESEEV